MRRAWLAAGLTLLLPAYSTASTNAAAILNSRFDGSKRHSGQLNKVPLPEIAAKVDAGAMALKPAPAVAVPAPKTPKAAYYGAREFINTLSWISNLTWGLFNTVVGLITLLIFGTAKLLSEGTCPNFYFSNEGGQLVVDSNMFNGWNISMGIFQFGSGAQSHEAGHMRQSAFLGPLYFPLVLLSYAIVGGHGGFIEDWADAWGS